MNAYAELKARQQQEFNALPLGFAFNDKQFTEMMVKWSLDPDKDIDKILSIGFGGFVQKKDADKLHEVRERHDLEMSEAIAADKTGEGFVADMFYEELLNHEYGYTREFDETLDALGFTARQVVDTPNLKRGLEKAVERIEREEEVC